jgi:ABC-type nitrate/sulfonate/bicarbonate transport system permease component
MPLSTKRVAADGSAHTLATQQDDPIPSKRKRGENRQAAVKLRRVALGLALPLALFSLWQISATAGWITSNNWPRFSLVLTALALEMLRGELPIALLQTIGLVVGGFAIGAALGIGLAFASAVAPLLGSGLGTLVELLRVIPIPALVPPLVLLFGTGLEMKLIVVAASVLFPVFLNTLVGIVSIEPQLKLVARMHGLGPRALLRDILFPGALPGIFAGLRIGFGIALVVAVTAEIIVGDSGIGHYLVLMQFAARPAEMYGAVLLLLLFGSFASLPFKWMESSVIFWRHSRQH